MASTSSWTTRRRRAATCASSSATTSRSRISAARTARACTSASWRRGRAVRVLPGEAIAIGSLVLMVHPTGRCARSAAGDQCRTASSRGASSGSAPAPRRPEERSPSRACRAARTRAPPDVAYGAFGRSTSSAASVRARIELLLPGLAGETARARGAGVRAAARVGGASGIRVASYPEDGPQRALLAPRAADARPTSTGRRRRGDGGDCVRRGEHAPRTGAGRARRRRRHQRAHPGRDRRRQGGPRASDPRGVGARRRGRWSPSTARRCRRRCSRASCSATSAAPSPARPGQARAARDGAGRHGVPRRGRRAAARRCRPSCCA